MFSKKFISFTVISGVLASTISQLGFAENDNVDSLETLSSSEDLAVKDETEKVEDLNKNENSGDDSSTDVEDLEDGEDNEDHEGTENKARSVVNLYQRGKEALVNKFEDVKPYLKKGKDVLKKVVNHDAFLPTFTGLASAAGTYKLLEKLNNRNTTNENLTQVQNPEQPQEDVVTPSSTTQQDTSSEEEINKKSDTENNDSDVTNTSDSSQNDQLVDDKRHLHFVLSLVFIFLFFGGAYFLWPKYIQKMKEEELRKEKEEEKLRKEKEEEELRKKEEELRINSLIEALNKTSEKLYNMMQPLSTGKLLKIKVKKDSHFYNYLKKVGLIKRSKKSVTFTTFPYFKLELKNFKGISSPKVDVLLFNVFIDAEDIGEDREEFMQIERKGGFEFFSLLGKKLTFNLNDNDEFIALAQLIDKIEGFADNYILTEEQQKNNDIKAIVGHLSINSSVYGYMEGMLDFLEHKQLLSEVDLYKALCKGLGIEIDEEVEIKKNDESIENIITTKLNNSPNINTEKENNEGARIKSKNIKAILEGLFYKNGGMPLKEDVILNEEDLFAILKEKFLKINMPEAQRKRIFGKPKVPSETKKEIKQDIVTISISPYYNNFKNKEEFVYNEQRENALSQNSSVHSLEIIGERDYNINQNNVIKEEGSGSEDNNLYKGNNHLDFETSGQSLNNNIISKNNSFGSNEGNNDIGHRLETEY